ncbi:hypothetical protein DSO57_1014858 [Entomophthora muscae]|uniref:Uncharacterized protein n=1 Tax=Entomophthora muscae TaxID=34485 RepID=A0ACC2RWJ8_9FUNG|nr:hypothetical protein DSO57_1014858 [Entomophthora muscae]
MAAFTTTPFQFLYILDNLPNKANNLLSTGKNLDHGLKSDNCEFPPSFAVPRTLQEEETKATDPVEVNELPLLMTFHCPQSMLPSVPPGC